MNRLSVRPLCLGMLWLALAPCAEPARAAEPEAPATAAAAAAAPDAAASANAAGPAADLARTTAGALEATRSAVRSATEWVARTVDGWFGEERIADRVEVSNGRLSLQLSARQGENPEARVRFSARIHLPNLEREAAYVFIGRDDTRELVRDKPEELSPQQLLIRREQDDPSLFAGVGVPLNELVDFRLGFRGGLKPYAQARYQYAWPLTDAGRAEFRQTLFWSVDERLGSTTTLAFTAELSPTLTGRWLNSGTITQDSPDFEWSSVLGGYKAFGRQRQAALELIISGTQNTGVPVSDYGLQAKWEQPVHEDWLLLEVIVGHFWPRDTPQSERGREWAAGGALKLRF